MKLDDAEPKGVVRVGIDVAQGIRVQHGVGAGDRKRGKPRQNTQEDEPGERQAGEPLQKKRKQEVKEASTDRLQDTAFHIVAAAGTQACRSTTCRNMPSLR